MDHVGFWKGIEVVLVGKGHLRMIVQPTIAIILGIRLGVSDAKAGRAPFLLQLFTGEHRKVLLKQALKDILIPLTVAVVLDGILQAITLHRVRPLAALMVGGLLVALPFAIARALTNRVVTRSHHRPAAGGEALRPA